MKHEAVRGSRMRWRACALILALGAVAVVGEKTPTLASPPYYKILNLNTLNPDPLCTSCDSYAYDVNIWGVVVGTSIENPAPLTFRGFRTDPNKAIVPTDVLGPYLQGTDSQAFGVNDSGVTVGMSFGAGSGGHAVKWPVGYPQFQLIISLGQEAAATEVNNSGVAVGGFFNAWVGNSANLLPATGIQSYADDINDDGVVVGSHVTVQAPRAARWTDGGLEELGTLCLSGATCGSAAFAINNNGFIVGASQFVEPSFKRHAFLWSQRATFMTDLGTLCTGLVICESHATDINIHNHIVGQSDKTTVFGDVRAFLYKEGDMHDLNTLLAPADQANWVLTEAHAINDLGQIAGTGQLDGNKTRAFLLTPPVQFIFDAAKQLLEIFAGELFSDDQSLRAKLDAAEAAFGRGNVNATSNQLDVFDNQVEVLVRSRRLDQTRAMKLRAATTLLRAEIETDGREQ